MLLTVTVQVPVPLHAPLHPWNIELPVGVAANITCAPQEKLPLQFAVQLMPAGLLVTIPVPLVILFIVMLMG